MVPKQCWSRTAVKTKDSIRDYREYAKEIDKKWWVSLRGPDKSRVLRRVDYMMMVVMMIASS